MLPVTSSIIIDAGGSRSEGMAISGICDSVCTRVSALKVKRLELSTPNSVPRHALTLRYKGQRLWSQGYEAWLRRGYSCRYDWLGFLDNVTKENRIYIMYCNAARGGPSHDRRQHAPKICRSLDMWFVRYACGQTDKHAQYNISHPSRDELICKNKEKTLAKYIALPASLPSGLNYRANKERNRETNKRLSTK